ncbi:MAG: hypothetical protein HC848_08000 [Limnobacter sp.]|nr:hypothetical protein [Limnobacter sp.]
MAQLIIGIQKDTDDAVKHVTGWKDIVSTGMSDSKTAEEAMLDITGYSRDTEKGIGDINHALGEQSSASQVIAQKIESIAQMTEESQAAAQKLMEVATESRRITAELTGSIAKFQLDKTSGSHAS